MTAPRSAGLILHPTSFPGRFGVGDLGPDAERVLEWMAAAGLTLWQVLPLGPTGFGDSPYTTLSSFAGNPFLISPERLREDGLVERSRLAGAPRSSPSGVAYEATRRFKEGLFRAAWARLRAGDHPLRGELEAFTADPSQRAWLDDWTLYAALKEAAGGRSWTDWDPPLRRREPEALAEARRRLGGETAFHGFVQFLFFRQWARLSDRAAALGLRIVADLPFYPALDSADVWSAASLFDLDGEGRPRGVAGVPPDYFSADGQLWGNPVYVWDRHEGDGFRWWLERVRATLRLAGLVRLDHFRGFCAHWRVPAGEPTAATGAWVPGPGARLFGALHNALGTLPFLAEDLGEITPDVESLRRLLGLPGTRVLQFAFEDPASTHLPHLLEPDVALYTGTHDNDTSRGWFTRLDRRARARVLDYLGAAPADVPWGMVRAAWVSVARWALAPAQDLLGLGRRSRMNTPGRAGGNWRWRLRRGQLGPELADRLRRLSEAAGRSVGLPPAEDAGRKTSTARGASAGARARRRKAAEGP